MPTNPATAAIQSWDRVSNPVSAATLAIANPANAPAPVPANVTPPSVPEGTRFQVVIRSAVPPRVWPISLATVSVAASANAAIPATIHQRLPVTSKTIEQAAATPRLASTCHPLRPSPRSATPNSCLRRNPSRVATHVSRKSAARAAKAPGPALAYRTKQAIPPATAPDPLTPRNARASAAKPTVTAPATAIRPGPVAQPCANSKVSLDPA